MYEQAKLDEAKYFYSLMAAEHNDRQKFNYNLSAFLTSARSVLQYALDEAQTENGGQTWYSKQISTSHILSFFKDKRDVNIHAEPVKPSMNATVFATATVGIRASASVIVHDSKGNIKYQSPMETSDRQDKQQAKEKQADITIRYRFSDWKGTEDVMTLSQMYLDELKRLVEDGKQKGFLTEG